MLYRGVLLTVVWFLSSLSVGCETSPARATTAVVPQQDPALVRPLVDFRSLNRSPFPSDRLTVADTNQNTGRRVHLPIPQDCARTPQTAKMSRC